MAEKIIKGEGGREHQRKVERNLGRKRLLLGKKIQSLPNMFLSI